MWTLVIVKLKIVRQTSECFSDHLVILEIDFLILYRSPQTFDDDVINGSAASIHAYPYPIPIENANENITGKLTALV